MNWNTKLRLDELKEEHIDSAVDLLVRSLTASNVAECADNIHEEVRKCVLLSARHQGSFVLLDNRRVVGVVVQEEIKQYRDLPILIDEVEETQTKQQATTENTDQVKGDSIYSSLSSVESAHSNSVTYRKLWSSILAISKLTGLKTYYARVDSKQSYEALLSLGAEDISADDAKSDSCKVVYVNLMELSSQSSKRHRPITPKL